MYTNINKCTKIRTRHKYNINDSQNVCMNDSQNVCMNVHKYPQDIHLT